MWSFGRYSERKKRKSPFSTTPVSFEAPSPANPFEYPHKPYFTRNYDPCATFLSLHSNFCGGLRKTCVMQLSTYVGNRFTGVTATSCNYNDVSTALSEERVQIHLKRDKRARHGQAKNPCAFPRFSIAPSVRASFPVTFTLKTNPLHSMKACHTALIKIVCVRLLAATAIWRTIIHCYWLLALLTQYVGLKFPYTSIRLSFDNSLDIIIQRWLNTYRYARIY